jgi:acetyl-CoA C-acetyltransferase
VATYSVVHGRDGRPDWGLAVVDLPEGDRAYAKVLEPALLADMEATEWVGRSVTLTNGGDGVNLIGA